jgi:hypothetical protein
MTLLVMGVAVAVAQDASGWRLPATPTPGQVGGRVSDADRNDGSDRGKARQTKKSFDDKLNTCLAFLEDVGLFDGWVALLSYALLSKKERKWLIK